MSNHVIPSNKFSGPYRATKLWNDAVRSFYNGMPLSRHWRGLRQYENCFTASEAINWLREYLRSNPNFGPSVTRAQAIKLLQKFIKCGLIVEARGNKFYAEDFQDNRELFRFGNQSPLKALRTPNRAPLAPLVSNALANNGSSPLLLKDKIQNKSFNHDGRRENTINEKKEEKFVPCENLKNEDVNLVWKDVFFKKLQWVSEKLLVGGDGSSPLLPMSSINAMWIRHNINLLKSKGISRAEGFCSDQLPDWIMSAMRSLVNWPNSSDSICNIPNYPGVEVDIFKVVREFFTSMVIPLIPYELYDPIIRLYIGAEFLDIANRTPASTQTPLRKREKNDSFSTLSSCDSVEDLILNISLSSSKHHILSPSTTNVKNASNCFSLTHPDNDKNSITRKCKDYIDRTPTGNKKLEGISTLPRSLKLNRLTDYTDFKDSYLYPDEEEVLQPFLSTVSNLAEKSSSNSTGRTTLKSLKQKANLSSKNGHLKGHSGKSSSTFSTLLKTEELDNFSLPPNSCFETAFTSDSPRTRVIPQKSVDTIHIRNLTISSRPKSIAVSSFSGFNTLNSQNRNKLKLSSLELNKEREISPLKDSGNSFLNRSVSEGNLLHTEVCDRGGTRSLVPRKTEFSLRSRSIKKSFCSKSSLAAKVRDSIKKKRGKDCVSKNNASSDDSVSNVSVWSNIYDNNPLLTASRVSSNSASQREFSLEAIKRLRTKSGGYANPAYSVITCTPDTLSLKSSISEVNQSKNNSGDYINFMLGQSMNSVSDSKRSNETKSTHTGDSASYYSDMASLCNSNSISASSPIPSEGSSINEKASRYSYRSKSLTPIGCLSHSMASCTSNSIYHSALSGFNQSSLSSTPVLMKTATDLSYHMNQTTSPPEIPKRQPALQMNSSEFDSFRHNEDNEDAVDIPVGYANDIRNLSSSASELSDTWMDRTPFGTAPPFVRGGLWKHYHSSPSKRLMGRGNRLLKASGNGVCLPGLLTRNGKEVCIEALQLVFLVIEPKRRRRLYLLLKMMNKVSSNEKLQLDGDMTNRALMVKTFSRSVMLSQKERDYDEMLSTRIVTFLMDNYATIFSPPPNLAVLVHRKINSNAAERVQTLPQDSHGREGCSPSTSHPITYCLQVSPETFEKQKFTGSQQFLLELIDQILENPKLSDREKKKKLKEFRTHYPELYESKFPPGKENEMCSNGREKKKRLKVLKKFTSIRSLTRNKSLRI